MGTNNKYFDWFLFIYCVLNAIAIVLALFRSDYKKIVKDLKVFFKFNNWWLCFGIIILLFSIVPFTIPFTIKNVYNKIKGDK